MSDSGFRARLAGVRSPLGFGVSGPLATALVSPEATRQLVLQAFADGVRVFDTGPSYGAGEAERRLGAALQTLQRAQCLVITKIGTIAGPMGRLRKDFSREGMARSLRGSLSRLRIAQIDLLLAHGPSVEDLPGFVDVAQEARASGLIGAFGVCGRGPEVEVALTLPGIEAILAPIHAGDATRAEHLYAATRGTPIVLLGFEALSAARRPPRSILRPADWFYLARAAHRRMNHPASPELSVPPALTSAEALRFAAARSDCVIMTTTSAQRLRANIVALRQPINVA